MADENYRRPTCADLSCAAPRRPSRYVKKLIYLLKACKQCGTPMRGTARQLEERVFCSRQCNADDRKQHNIKSCEICQKHFHRRLGGAQRGKGLEARFCSNLCKFLGQRLDEQEIADRAAAKEREKALRSLATAIRRLHRKREKAEPIVCACVDCGLRFTPMQRKRRGVCRPCLDARAHKLKRSMKARGKAMRRARMAIDSERFDPHEIFERDRWCCVLCGVATPKGLRGSYHDNAPELDHIIPLARGGSHTRANTQCTCRACNITKGAHARGQLGGPQPDGWQMRNVLDSV